jgi:hypothetical protein
MQDIKRRQRKDGKGDRIRGKLPRNLNGKLVNNEQSCQWLKFGDIMGETECTTVIAEDKEISANDLKNKTFKEEIGNKCRLCKQREETIDHVTSGCSSLAKNEFVMR